jgi:hypothetical protein
MRISIDFLRLTRPDKAAQSAQLAVLTRRLEDDVDERLDISWGQLPCCKFVLEGIAQGRFQTANPADLQGFNVWIAEMLRLPFFWRDNGPIYAWPPPTPPAFVSCLVPSGPGPNWLEESKARDAARREESLRVVAHYEAQRREREEREFKEGREAMAREVAERNRRLGWPY